jgi:cytochrome c553
MTRLRHLAATSAMLATAWLSPLFEAQAADATAVPAAAQLCLACHGPQGISTQELTPHLAGQPDAFIQWQLVYFRSKNRKSDVMGPIAATLTDADIRALGKYYAALPPSATRVSADTAPELTERGRKLALANRCASCHGDTFNGAQAAARLANQREDYLLKALNDFKEGRRVGGGVSAMSDAVYPLSKDDMPALAHFLARQGGS